MDKDKNLLKTNASPGVEADDDIAKTEEIMEAMDSLFESQGPYSEDFSVIDLTNPAASPVWKLDYSSNDIQSRRLSECRQMNVDYGFHKSDTFPHMHHPLRPHHHYHCRHKIKSKEHCHDADDDSGSPDDFSKEPARESHIINIEPGSHLIEEESSMKRELSVDGAASVIPRPKPYLGLRSRTITDTSIMSTDEEDMPSIPLLLPEIMRLRSCIRSETDTAGSEDESCRKKGKVKFDVGSDAADSDQDSRRRLHRRKKYRRHDGAAEDLSWRRHLGSELANTNKQMSFNFTTTAEEALQLKEHDLDEMSSHRFEDSGLHRRHRLRVKSSVASIIHPSEQRQSRGGSKGRSRLQSMKKSLDHNPHEVFVELSELQCSSYGDLEWKETARWIKYEENVDDADNRWGKPHIAFLNFNALFALRKGLERGAVLLDLDETDLPSIATRVVDHMVTREQIPADQRDTVIKILLLRHKHIKENQSAFRRASRLSLLGSNDERLPNSQSSSFLDRRLSNRKGTLTNIFHVNTFGNVSRRNSAEDATTQNGGKPYSRHNSFTQIDLEDSVEKEKIRSNIDLLKKIPQGAEATAVLVGAVDFLKQPTIAFVRLAEGVMMENVIEVPIPVRFIFVLLGPFQGELDYHEVGRSISTLMSDKSFHEVAYRAHSRGQLLSAINEFLNASIVLPPSDWSNKDLIPIDDIRQKSQEILKKTESMRAKKKSQTLISALSSPDGEDDLDKLPPQREPLKREGKLFFGLIEDIKCRYPKYLSDIKDGLSPQVLSAVIFIFFASLSPSITFGGIYADKTDSYIGVGETLVVTSINGMIFALFAAQPLLIVGSTGPLMIFDMSLLQFCQSQNIDYLSIRVWVGLWMIVIGLIVAAFELVTVVKTFTRFTEEIFSTLVCVIFIYGAFEKLASIFLLHPMTTYSSCGNDSTAEGIYLVNSTWNNATMEYEELEITVSKNEPNTALLSLCLMIGTFLIAFKLKKFRNSKFLGRSVRRALGDFGVPIAIFSMVLADYLIKDTYTDKLNMPTQLEPSNAKVRNWIIDPFGVVDPLPVWCMFAAGPAALLLFILIFLEENICHLILSKPERCLKKGSGFHLDIVLSCLINTISGFLGAPFMGPACVRTISHMSALTIVSSNVAPGESPKIIGCQEQRVSGFVVALLVGLSVFMSFILTLVPTSVLLGIFLYMGVSATAGIQLIERLVLFFMPVKHHPNVAYVKKVRTWKMHTFTAVELLMLVVLWVVKQGPASLCVPFILMLLIPIRLYLLPYVFSSLELMALDGTEQSSLMESPDSEPDFYETAHDLPVQVRDDGHTHQS